MSLVSACLVLLLFWYLPLTGVSAAEFSDHPVPLVPSCKGLDFDSYSRAQASKGNLLQLNPERGRPNFGGKYLLLKNELMLETVWLIADCSTGKFFREILSGDAEFKSDSLVVILKNKGARETHLWNGNGWNKIGERQVPPLVAKTASAPIPLSKSACKKIDFDSHPLAQVSRKNILELNPDVTQPNFGTRYLLLRNRVIFDTRWFIVDCESGKFFPPFLTGDLAFQPDSLLIVIQNSGSKPSFKVWTEDQWQDRPDPSATEHEAIENTIYNENAKTLFHAIPNPHGENTLRFQNLKCTFFSPSPPHPAACSVEIPGKEKNSETISIPESEIPALEQLIKTWGFSSKRNGPPLEYQIRSGTCLTERSRLLCKITI